MNNHFYNHMSDTKTEKFFDIFEPTAKGDLKAKQVVEINGVTLSPGVTLSKGVILGGVDFFDVKFFGKDVVVELTDDNKYVIKGFYTS